MRYREVQIEDDKSIGDSGTEIIDINVTDPITALVIRFKATNDTSALLNQPPEMQISDVEIVDGGATYWSLNGPMAVAAAVYGLDRWPHQWYDERASVNQRCNFPLLFGRFLGDPQFAFNPTALRNPQLKVTWTDQAGYLDDSLTLGVTARVMEDAPMPAQCLMWKEVESWTPAASGDHTVDLPVDYPYRALMMRTYEAGVLPSTKWTNFKLDCDVGKFIAFDLASHEFRDIIKQYSGPFHHRQFFYGTSTTNRQCWMGEVLSVSGSAYQHGHIATFINYFYPWVVVDIETHAGVSQTTIGAQAIVSGLFPHSAYKYDFGRPNDPETWFDPTVYGDVDLKITEGNAGGVAAVAVQQPRSLP